MKKVMITLIMVIVCTAALFADMIIAEDQNTLIFMQSEDTCPEIPGEWSYYERFESYEDYEFLNAYMSRMMRFAENLDETLDMRITVDGYDAVCIMTTDMNLIDTLAG